MEIVKNSLCRLCLKRNLKLICVFTESEIELPKYIYQFFDIKIKQNDPYSTYICISCWTLLDALYKRRMEYCKNNAILSRVNLDAKIAQTPITNAFSNCQNFHPSVQAIFQKYTCLHLKVEYWKKNFDAFVDLSICKLSPEVEELFTMKLMNSQKTLNSQKPIKRKMSTSSSNYLCSVKSETHDRKTCIPSGISVRRMSQSNENNEIHKYPTKKITARRRKSNADALPSLSCDKVFGTLNNNKNKTLAPCKYISNDLIPQSYNDSITSNTQNWCSEELRRNKPIISKSNNATLKSPKKTITARRKNGLNNLNSPNFSDISSAIQHEEINRSFTTSPKLKQLNNKYTHSYYRSLEDQPQEYSSITDIYNNSYIEFDKNIQGLKNTLSSIKNPKRPRRYSTDPSYRCSETTTNIMRSIASQTPNDTINYTADTRSAKRSKRSNKRRVMFGDPLTQEDDDYYTETVKSFNTVPYNYKKPGISSTSDIISPVSRMNIEKEMRNILRQISNEELEKEAMLSRNTNLRSSIDSITIDENNIKEEITDEEITYPTETIHCPEDTWNNFFTQNYTQVSSDIDITKMEEIIPEPKLFLTSLEQQVFLCQLCDNVFDNQHALNRHLKRHTNSSMFSFVDVSHISLSANSFIPEELE